MLSDRFTFIVPDITCGACTGSIENSLHACQEIKVKASGNAMLKKIFVTVEQELPCSTEKEAKILKPDEIAEILKRVINDAGFECQLLTINRKEIDVQEEIIPSEIHPSDNEETTSQEKIVPKPNTSRLIKVITFVKKILRNRWVMGIMGCVSGFTLLILSIWGLGIPFAALCAIGGFSTLLTLYLGAESYWDAITKLIKSRTMTMDTLFTISSLAALGVSIASLFFPGLPMMFDAALLIFGFRHIGKGIKDTIRQKIISSITFRELAPKEIAVEGSLKKIPILAVKPGDIIIVQPGHIIPLDGLCLNTSSIHEFRMNGSDSARTVNNQDTLLAGMEIDKEANAIHMQVIRKEADSWLVCKDREIEQALEEKAPIECITEMFMQYFVPMVMLTAVVAGAILGAFFPPALAIISALCILVSTCPCILGLIVPLAVTMGIAKARENGVQFKSGKYLQAAHHTNMDVVFDLTGTLIKGTPQVCEWDIDDTEWDSEEEESGDEEESREERFFACLQALESQSKHPIAQAICSYIEKNRQLSKLTATEVDESHHAGRRAKINNQRYTIGNKTMMQELNIDFGKFKNVSEDLSLKRDAEHIVFLARENKVIGYLTLKDPLREDAKIVVEELKRTGKTIHLCTGADRETANYYAKQLGIDPKHVKANCMALDDPSSKTPRLSKKAYIEKLKKEGRKVVMVGDAANDASAFAVADLGILVESPATDNATKELAGAIIQKNSLIPILTVFAVAKQSINNIKLNLLTNFLFNFGVVGLLLSLSIPLGFAINPGVGVALMVLQASLVLGAAYYLKCKKLPHIERLQSLMTRKKKNENTHHYVRQRSPLIGGRRLSQNDLLSHQDRPSLPARRQSCRGVKSDYSEKALSLPPSASSARLTMRNN